MYNGPNLDTIEVDARPATGGFGPVHLAVVGLIAAAVFGGWWYSGRAARVAAADREAGIKPVLLMFTADWCGPCQNFKRAVLADDRVLRRVHGSCTFGKVDLTRWEGEPAEVARRFGVRSIPTLMLVNSAEQEIDRYNGPHDPEVFAQWIDRHTE